MKVAFVDDDENFIRIQKAHLVRAEQEVGVNCEVFTFSDGLDLLEHYGGGFDILFLDVEMPHLDGLETARRVRKMDQEVCIIFMTNMARYAIHGYEVNALDFVVKPVSYYVFADKLRRAMRFVRLNTRRSFVLQTDEMIVRVTTPQILYIEKDKNYLVYHTQDGDYRVRGTMAALEDELRGEGFSVCFNGCMVNLRYVTGITKDSVLLGEISLPVSRHRRKEFKEDFLKYLGGDL